MGRAAERLVWGDAQDDRQRRQAGLLLCVWPYLVANLVLSLLALQHPVGLTGTVAVLFKFWFGFGGFFWAYLIVFQWSDFGGPYRDATPLSGRLPRALPLLVVLFYALAAMLLAGVYPGWTW